jgi:hypothetical protein
MTWKVVARIEERRSFVVTDEDVFRLDFHCHNLQMAEFL